MTDSRARKLTRETEAFLGDLRIERCLDCPFALGSGPYTCALTVEPQGDGVKWRRVHGNVAPPTWCPIRKHGAVRLSVDVEPSPDHWHEGGR